MKFEESSLSELRRTPYYLILVQLPILQKQAYIGSEKFSRYTIQLKWMMGGLKETLWAEKLMGKEYGVWYS